MWTDERVQSFAEPMRRQNPCDIDMRAHRQRMDARIGPPGGGEYRLLAGHSLKRFLERLLDRRAMILALPAHEWPAVIFHNHSPAGHLRIVPFGIANPRSRSP